MHLDRGSLLDLIHDLYDAHQDNRTFLHTRCELAGNSLEPYKGVVGRWMWPDPFSRGNPSASKAKQAIAAYKQAAGDPRNLAELMIFFREQGTGFCADLGYQDETFMNSLWRMFECSNRQSTWLESCRRPSVIRSSSRSIGSGIPRAKVALASATRSTTYCAIIGTGQAEREAAAAVEVAGRRHDRHSSAARDAFGSIHRRRVCHYFPGLSRDSC